MCSAHAYNGQPICSGQTNVVVHLFEWKWADVASECSALAQLGYCAVQVSPPQEHAVLEDPGTGLPPYPWWQRYQPVSYALDSRSGSHQEFVNMVETCNDVGVYIYVDAVIQHMTGGQSGYGSSGSFYDGATEDYPGVPFSTDDFHKQQPDECTTSSGEIEDYSDAQQVRFCRLVGLRDLRTANDYVRDMLVEYLNTLVDIGVAGFRVDACKHTMPEDLEHLYTNMHDLPTRWFPAGSRPYVFQEVIYVGGDEPIRPEHYTHIGRVTEFRYSANIGNIFRGWDGQQLSYLEDFGEGWGFMDGLDAVVFIDNHDNQRGHGPGGDSVLTYKDDRLYKMATAFELAWPYGQPRVMSSFAFDDTEAGPPSDGNGNTYDVECFNGEWVCEHRWHQIENMVGFHNAALGTGMSHWRTISDNAIAFGREGTAFIVINNEDHEVSGDFETGMPDGEYCDVISCDGPTPPCNSCGSVTVSGGNAHITVPNDSDSMVAIHV
ncbi:hypothetical protein CAPTEDRAFT_162476 [Capitella teleta]|uniref:Alpha-amylase n=1 Tax=Capitella teleta TaxID=283909 RepID=R7T4D7_CAPTE|nr:hypothetical protein CAPTEDRAFT_162476 [Capitella teleta]|eukprot:ELT87753.1 hypothetical protein CAPTEDRAFT_162476 [Capitella teleta]